MRFRGQRHAGDRGHVDHDDRKDVRKSDANRDFCEQMPRRPKDEKPLERDAASLNGRPEKGVIGIEKGAPRPFSPAPHARLLAGRTGSECNAETMAQIGRRSELDDTTLRKTPLRQNQRERRRDLQSLSRRFRKRAERNR